MTALPRSTHSSTRSRSSDRRSRQPADPFCPTQVRIPGPCQWRLPLIGYLAIASLPMTITLFAPEPATVANDIVRATSGRTSRIRNTSIREPASPEPLVAGPTVFADLDHLAVRCVKFRSAVGRGQIELSHDVLVEYRKEIPYRARYFATPWPESEHRVHVPACEAGRSDIFSNAAQ